MLVLEMGGNPQTASEENPHGFGDLDVVPSYVLDRDTLPHGCDGYCEHGYDQTFWSNEKLINDWHFVN